MANLSRHTWWNLDIIKATGASLVLLVLLVIGIDLNHPAAGAIAAGAAVSVAFGGFKRVHGSAHLAMALAGALWLHRFARKTIQWRNQEYRIAGGALVAVPPRS